MRHVNSKIVFVALAHETTSDDSSLALHRGTKLLRKSRDTLHPVVDSLDSETVRAALV